MQFVTLSRQLFDISICEVSKILTRKIMMISLKATDRKYSGALEGLPAPISRLNYRAFVSNGDGHMNKYISSAVGRNEVPFYVFGLQNI